MAEVDTSIYPKIEPSNFIDTANKYVSLASGATQVQQQHLDLVKNQVGYLVNGFSALASKKDLSPQDFVDFGQRALQEGIISPDVYQAEIENVSKAGNDPQALRNLATNYGLRALDAGQRFSAQYGQVNNIQTGGFIQPTIQSPLTGSTPIPDSAIPMTLSPETLAAPDVVAGPNGTPVAGTRGQALTQQGVDINTGRPNGLVGAPAAPMPAPAPLAAPAAPPAPAAAPAVGPLPVGAVEAAKATGAASGDLLAQDRTVASNYQTTVLPLEQAIAHIEALPANATGPGQEDINTIQSFLQSMGIPVTDPQKIANFDELKKYLVQLGRTNGNTSTNDQLATALSGSPGTTVSTLANKDILKTLLGMARLRNAQVATFDKSGLPDSAYGKWAATFNTEADPRAYAFDLMDPAQRQKLIDGMSPAEKAKFIKSLRVAVELGLVQPPNG